MSINAIIMYKSCGPSNVEFVPASAGDVVHGFFFVFAIGSLFLCMCFGCGERGLALACRIFERRVLGGLLYGRFW